MSQFNNQNTPAIEVRDVSVVLGDQLILKNISLKVMHGETLVIIGPSGHGKTVLMKVMAGIYRPTSGHVLVEGEDWQDLKSEKKRELAKHLGMLFQKSALFDSLTAEQNIGFPLKEHTNMTDEQIHKRAAYVLKAVGLEQAINKYPHELSGGMQRRLGIARALALNPEIIFYDDPTAGQDPITSDKIAELLMDLKKQSGSTVIVVTNDMRRAYQMADRIIMVIDQEVIDCGTVEETKNSKNAKVQAFTHGKAWG